MKNTNKVVAVTQRIDAIPDRSEYRDAVDRRLLAWLLQAGFIGTPVPNILTADDSSIQLWLESIQPAAVLLSGGNDIGEYPLRDDTEKYLLNWASERRVPVLGICRGLQLMAVWAGAELTRIKGHVRTEHQTIVLDAADAGAWPQWVNSYHDWGLVSCPLDFVAQVEAEDGSIEAIRHVDLPWEGWMWHPERYGEFVSEDTTRMQRLFNGD